MKPKKYDVFISYSRKDYVDDKNEVIPGNTISAIKDALKQANISYWFDEEGIFHGDSFTEKIVTSIEQADILIFVSSKNSNKSKYTPKEIGCAFGLNKPIIPIKIDKSSYNTNVLFWLADINFINYYQNPSKGLKDLVAAVKSQLSTIEKKRLLEIEKQKELIASLETRCENLNNEESRVEERRHELLSETEDITNEEDRNRLRAFIIESSPIRKKCLSENESYIHTSMNSGTPPNNRTFYEKLCKWASSVQTSISGRFKSFRVGVNKIFPTFKKLNNSFFKSCRELFKRIFTSVKRSFASMSQKIKGLSGNPKLLRSLLWIVIGAAVCSIAYYVWKHPLARNRFTTDDTVVMTEKVTYVPGEDILKDSIHDIIGQLSSVDSTLQAYYDGFMQNDLESTYLLGKCFEKGQYLDQADLSLAAQLVRRAAEEGYADAQTTLGFYFFHGREGTGCMRDYDSASHWYNQAIDNGSVSAKYYLGFAYYTGCYEGRRTHRPNFTKGIEYYMESAEEGYGRSLYALGDYYQNNKKDYKTAFEYYEKAINTKDLIQEEMVSAFTRLGDFCKTGKTGIEKNLSEALKWYELAATCGDVNSMINVAKYYDSGIGTEKDTALANKWYEKAAATGNKRAIDILSHR